MNSTLHPQIAWPRSAIVHLIEPCLLHFRSSSSFLRPEASQTVLYLAMKHLPLFGTASYSYSSSRERLLQDLPIGFALAIYRIILDRPASSPASFVIDS